jgi:hypothetical protein
VKEPMDWCEPQDRPTFYGADRNCPPWDLPCLSFFQI